MAFAASGWALERVLGPRPSVGTPEKRGVYVLFCDNGLLKNELRSIVETAAA